MFINNKKIKVTIDPEKGVVEEVVDDFGTISPDAASTLTVLDGGNNVNITYTPSNTSAWASPPDDIATAINQLADSSLQGGGVSATLTTLDGQYHTILSSVTDNNSATTIESNVVANRSDSTKAGAFVFSSTFLNNSGSLSEIGTKTSILSKKTETDIDATYAISGSSVLLKVKGKSPFDPPSQPTFTGTIRSVPSAYATVTAAVAAATAGDIIEIAENTTITESAQVVINKSLEIRGKSRTTSIVQGTFTVGVLSIQTGTNNVWIHDLTIKNNTVPSTDAGGLSSCVTASTQAASNQSGSTGLRFENLDLVCAKTGLMLDASGFVINNCKFSCNVSAPGTTVRQIFIAGSTGETYITNNTHVVPNESGRVITTFFNTAGPRYSPTEFYSGYSGKLYIISNSIDASSGYFPSAYVYFEDVMSPPRTVSTTPPSSNTMSLYIVNNNYNVQYTANPITFFGRQSMSLSYFNTLQISGNSSSNRTSSSSKGLFFVTSLEGGSGFSFGTPSVFYASSNSVVSQLPSGTNVNASTTVNLLGLDTTKYTLPAPLLTPLAPQTVTWSWTANIKKTIAK